MAPVAEGRGDEGGEDGWVPMWRRRPPWMYLPSQTVHIDDVQAKTLGAAHSPRRGEVNGGAATCSGHGAHPSSIGSASSRSCRRGDRENVGDAGCNLERGATGHHDEAADHSGAMHGGGGARDHEQGAAQLGGSGSAGMGMLGDTDNGDLIRGHPSMPGALRVDSALGQRAGVVLDDERINGPPARPGAIGGVSTSREQRRLDKLNANLTRSFADHAERVEKKRARGTSGDRPATAAERMAAIRRRLRERSTAPVAGREGVDAGSAFPTSSGQAGDTACHQGTLEAVRREGLEDSSTTTSVKTKEVSNIHQLFWDEHRGSSAGPRITAGVHDARTHVAADRAWHGREQRREAGVVIQPGA